MTKKDLILLLPNEIVQTIEEMNYTIGDGFKTHSSTFYNLSKGEKTYLLKMDQTKSGSLIHQKKYSDTQLNAGVQHLPVVFMDDDNQYLILEKLQGFSNMGDVLDEDSAQLWGKTMCKIHEQGKIDTYSIWVEEYGEFMNIGFKDTVEQYLELAGERMAGLSYDQERKVREVISFIRSNIDKYEQPPVLVHGDPNINNTVVYGGKPLIYDPSGTVLYGSRYIDLAIIAIDFAGYFVDGISNSTDDKLYMSSFLKGYGNINLESLHYYILLRGVERYSFSSFIKNVDVLTDHVYEKLTGRI
jgi:fructosamine-3-kinase